MMKRFGGAMLALIAGFACWMGYYAGGGKFGIGEFASRLVSGEARVGYLFLLGAALVTAWSIDVLRRAHGGGRVVPAALVAGAGALVTLLGTVRDDGRLPPSLAIVAIGCACVFVGFVIVLSAEDAASNARNHRRRV